MRIETIEEITKGKLSIGHLWPKPEVRIETPDPYGPLFFLNRHLWPKPEVRIETCRKSHNRKLLKSPLAKTRGAD